MAVEQTREQRLESALRDLMRHHRNSVASARSRIVEASGGDEEACDSVERMLQGNPYLRKAEEALAYSVQATPALCGLADYLRLMAHSQSAPEKLRRWAGEVDLVACVPEVPHVGESRFEVWYSEHDFDGRYRGPAHNKQDMRDAYAAGLAEGAAGVAVMGQQTSAPSTPLDGAKNG